MAGRQWSGPVARRAGSVILRTLARQRGDPTYDERTEESALRLGAPRSGARLRARRRTERVGAKASRRLRTDGRSGRSSPDPHRGEPRTPLHRAEPRRLARKAFRQRLDSRVGDVVLPQVELIWCLIGATILAFYFFRTGDYLLSKPESVILGMVYVLIVFLSFSF